MSRPLHIGYLVQQFPPEVGAGPARVSEMARHWIDAGCRVTVFTGMPNRPEGRIHAQYRGKLVTTEEIGGARVLRSWLYASPRHGLARTLANNVTFMATAAAHALARGGGVDVLIASSPPFFPHVSGRIAAGLRRIPLVLEVRDLWPDYIVDMGLLTPRGARPLFALERSLLRAADEVVVVTASFARRVVEKGVRPERVHLVPNGVDTGFYYRADEPPPVPELERRPDEFLVGYLGNFGAGQNLGAVLDAAALLGAQDPSIRFVLAGDGPDGAALRERAAGMANVAVLPPIAKDRTRAFYNACDVVLVPLANVPVFQETVPSKLFEVMACERPLVASLDGEGRRIVEESGGGIVRRPGDPGDIAEGIRAVKGMEPGALAAMGRAGRAYVEANYERRVLSARYLEVLRRAGGRRSDGG